MMDPMLKTSRCNYMSKCLHPLDESSHIPEISLINLTTWQIQTEPKFLGLVSYTEFN
jgi:hypothetical protein